jgi:hypothetical protein
MQKNVDGRVKPGHDGGPPSVISRAGVQPFRATFAPSNDSPKVVVLLPAHCDHRISTTFS